MKAENVSADGATARLEKHAAGEGYVSMVLERSANGEIPWTIHFSK